MAARVRSDRSSVRAAISADPGEYFYGRAYSKKCGSFEDARMSTIEIIQSELLELHAEAEAITAKAESENRDLSLSEKVRLNKITSEFEEKAESLKLRDKVSAHGDLL